MLHFFCIDAISMYITTFLTGQTPCFDSFLDNREGIGIQRIDADRQRKEKGILSLQVLRIDDPLPYDFGISSPHIFMFWY